MLIGLDAIIFLFPYNSSAGLGTANYMEGTHTTFSTLTFASDRTVVRTQV